jgi:hypothetical protein
LTEDKQRLNREMEKEVDKIRQSKEG